MNNRDFKDDTKIHYWTIIGYNKEKSKYITECVCGKKSHVSSTALKSGKSKSCGCKQKESVGQKIKASNFISIRKKIFSNYKAAAKRRKYDFSLSFQRFSELILKDCYYCGSKPNMIYKYGRGRQAIDYNIFKYNGVDRKNNFIGYNNENCVPCCKVCNNSKSTLSIEEWYDWINQIHSCIKLK